MGKTRVIFNLHKKYFYLENNSKIHVLSAFLQLVNILIYIHVYGENM